MFDINAYLKSLAESHADLLHTESHPAFFKEYSTNRILFDNSDFLNKLRYVKDNALVAQFNLEGGWDGPNQSQIHSFQSGAVFILSRLQPDEDAEAARDRCHRIFKDIKARIAFDIDSEIIPPTVSFDMNMRAHPVGMLADKFYGMMYLFSFDDYADCLEYNAGKWT
jgi:hypothetical protein